jgi:hypothetical protein
MTEDKGGTSTIWDQARGLAKYTAERAKAIREMGWRLRGQGIKLPLQKDIDVIEGDKESDSNDGADQK